MSERWTWRRRSLVPGACTTMTPTTQAKPSASNTPSAAPNSPSSAPSGDARIDTRRRPAMPSAPAEMIIPAISAPKRPNSGA